MTKKQYKLLRFIHRRNPTLDVLSKHMGHDSFHAFYNSKDWELLFDAEVESYTETDAYVVATGDTRIALNSEGIKAIESRFTDFFRWRITTGIAVVALILSVIAIIVQ